MNYEELNLEIAIKFAKQVDDWYVWKMLVQRLDLPIDQAIEFAKEVNDSDVWDVLVQKIKSFN